jgi:hypothetical protein
MSKSTDATGAIAERLRALGRFPADRFDGRGVVICAGGVQMFVNAYVLVRVLREVVRCALPIELWHLGPGELSPVMRRLLEPFGIELVDAYALSAANQRWIADGWQLKPYAVLNSRFREVLLLDADQVPVRDPAEIFQWPPYLETGALFWPDIVDLVAENPVWQMCGLTPRRCTSLESGQMLIDKSRQWKALHATLHLNEAADIFYQLVYGDKDTFLLGWLLTEAPHALVPHQPFTDSRCLTQRDFAGEPMFQHRTLAKWTYADPQIEVPHFVHETACRSFIADLRRVWNGRLYYPPERGLTARDLEDSLVGGRMRLIRFGEPDFELEFLAGHQFGIGRGPALQNWHVADGDSGSELVLRDAQRETCRLAPLPEGQWSGQYLIAPQTEVLLVPLSDKTAAPADDGLIADLVTASGLATCWTKQAEADLLAALQLMDRANPGIAERVRTFSRRRCAQNPGLRETLSRIAELVSTQPPVNRHVVRSRDVLERHYMPAWRSR